MQYNFRFKFNKVVVFYSLWQVLPQCLGVLLSFVIYQVLVKAAGEVTEVTVILCLAVGSLHVSF